MRRRSFLAIAAGALAAGAAGGYVAWRSLEADRRDAAALLALTLPDLAGREQAISQWKGKLLLVNFWATWCGPCREEMPNFVRVQAANASNGLQIVGIAVDQPDKVRQFANELGINYPILLGGYGAIELSRALGNTVGALPFTVVVDRHGKVVFTHLGALHEPRLGELLQGWLSAA